MSKLINMTGQQYGKLTVIGPHKYIKDKYKHSRTLWQVQCLCNNIFWTNRDNLIRKDIVQCRECKLVALKHNREKIKKHNLNYRLPYRNRAFNNLLARYKSQAKRRKFSFLLTKDQFKELTSSNCHYCNASPSMIGCADGRFNGTYIYNGIDRKNNFIGYELLNCVPCCENCNRAKLTMTYEQFKNLIKNIYKTLVNRGEL